MNDQLPSEDSILRWIILLFTLSSQYKTVDSGRDSVLHAAITWMLCTAQLLITCVHFVMMPASSINICNCKLSSLPLSCTNYNFYWFNEVNRSIVMLQSWIRWMFTKKVLIYICIESDIFWFMFISDVFYRRLNYDIGDEMADKLGEGKVCTSSEKKVFTWKLFS